MHVMEREDSRQEMRQCEKAIEARDETIKELTRRHDENVYLLKIMRRKIGNDFSIVHIATMTDTVFVEKHVQTVVVVKKHVDIQASGFNQREMGNQYEPRLNYDEDAEDPNFPGMPAKKLVKKKLKKRDPEDAGPALRRMATKRPLGLGAKSPRKGSIASGRSSNISSAGSKSPSRPRKVVASKLSSAPLPTILQKVKKQSPKQSKKKPAA